MKTIPGWKRCDPNERTPESAMLVYGEWWEPAERHKSLDRLVIYVQEYERKNGELQMVRQILKERTESLRVATEQVRAARQALTLMSEYHPESQTVDLARVTLTVMDRVK